MNDQITKGTLLKHYYLLGIPAFEALKHTVSFEGEGFVNRSMVYRCFKQFKESGLVPGTPVVTNVTSTPAPTKRKTTEDDGVEPKPKKPRAKKVKNVEPVVAIQGKNLLFKHFKFVIFRSCTANY